MTRDEKNVSERRTSVYVAVMTLVVAITAANARGDAKPRVVLTPVDTGINVYHDYFYADGPLYDGETPDAVTQDLLNELGIDASHRVTLTRTGDWKADRQADAAFWDRVNSEAEEGALWYFEGTNVIATSRDPNDQERILEPAAFSHGTAVSAAALAANPEAVLFFVESFDSQEESLEEDGFESGDGLEFAFGHPAVDVVSTSFGSLLSAPNPLFPALEGSFQGVVENGKLHFGASDNSPMPAVQDSTAGPWWSIGVSGFEEGTSEGRQLLSGSFTDFVADFSQELPACGQCEEDLEMVFGTSFATPRAAGTASRVILEERRSAGETTGIDATVDPPLMVSDPPITNWQVRRALEEAARYNGFSDWDPIEGVFDVASGPTLNPAPWLTLGWGILSPEIPGIVSDARAQLAGAEPRKSEEACQYMLLVHDLRHVYYDFAMPFSPTWFTMEDPYVHCDGS